MKFSRFLSSFGAQFALFLPCLRTSFEERSLQRAAFKTFPRHLASNLFQTAARISLQVLLIAVRRPNPCVQVFDILTTECRWIDFLKIAEKKSFPIFSMQSMRDFSLNVLETAAVNFNRFRKEEAMLWFILTQVFILFHRFLRLLLFLTHITKQKRLHRSPRAYSDHNSVEFIVVVSIKFFGCFEGNISTFSIAADHGFPTLLFREVWVSKE